MNRRKTAVLAVVAVIGVAGALGYAYVEGIGPLREDPAAGLEEPPETENVYDMGSYDEGVGEGGDGNNGEDDGAETDQRATPPFGFEVESIEECGRTCREVNAAVSNRMSEDAEEVVVYTWIYAGNTTEREDVVWAKNRDVGVLEAGETLRSTDRVNLSVQQAEKVRERDRWLTVEATVDSRQGTVRFTSRERAG